MLRSQKESHRVYARWWFLCCGAQEVQMAWISQIGPRIHLQNEYRQLQPYALESSTADHASRPCAQAKIVKAISLLNLRHSHTKAIVTKYRLGVRWWNVRRLRSILNLRLQKPALNLCISGQKQLQKKLIQQIKQLKIHERKVLPQSSQRTTTKD